MRLSVQAEAFDPGAQANAFAAGLASADAGAAMRAGALVTFTGFVRGAPERLVALEIEHYPGMCERAIHAMMEEAARRWPIEDALVIHRYGRLSLGAPIMMVALAAPHRADAFEAASFLMDYLKSRAPFWKQEIAPDGTSTWVESKAEDEKALSRW